jgi:ERCC4-type nuclease
MVRLIIDNRENIKDLLKEKIPDADFENLDIGDYQFKLDDEIFLIIERKTVSDYAASIVDSRSREQKKRLIANKSNANIMYLVEGDLTKDNTSFKYNKVDKHTIISSVINTMYRDNIQVFHTSNLMETIFFIESIHKKLNKQGKTFINNKTTYETDLINTVKICKKKNITPEINFQMMLNCIPGVSNKVSKRLVDKFKSMNSLISELDKIINQSEQIDYIKNIKMSDDVSAKKISKLVAENLIKNLGVIHYNDSLSSEGSNGNSLDVKVSET